jgi:hypothetical protein
MHALVNRDTRRHSQRQVMHLNHEVYLIQPGTDRAIKARIVDLSSEGIGIETSQVIPPGTELRLFSLSLSVSTKVIWGKTSSRWGKTIYRAGLRVTKASPDLVRVYAHLLNL